MVTRSPFTIKGLVVGSLFSLFIGVAAPYGSIVIRGSWWGLNASAPGAIFLFFIFTFLINMLIGIIRRPFALGRGDLVLVYSMLLMALFLSVSPLRTEVSSYVGRGGASTPPRPAPSSCSSSSPFSSICSSVSSAVPSPSAAATSSSSTPCCSWHSPCRHRTSSSTSSPPYALLLGECRK